MIAFIMLVALYALNMTMIGLCVIAVCLCLLHCTPGAWDEMRVTSNLQEEDLDIGVLFRRVRQRSGRFFFLLALGGASAVTWYMQGNVREAMRYAPGLVSIGGLLIAAFSYEENDDE